jgi:hypothetical protein
VNTLKQLTNQELSSLAFMQLEQFIKQGKHIAECKAEWKRRNGCDYPQTINLERLWRVAD